MSALAASTAAGVGLTTFSTSQSFFSQEGTNCNVAIDGSSLRTTITYTTSVRCTGPALYWLGFHPVVYDEEKTDCDVFQRTEYGCPVSTGDEVFCSECLTLPVTKYSAAGLSPTHVYHAGIYTDFVLHGYTNPKTANVYGDRWIITPPGECFLYAEGHETANCPIVATTTTE
jgi:hypothetical protein